MTGDSRLIFPGRGPGCLTPLSLSSLTNRSARAVLPSTSPRRESSAPLRLDELHEDLGPAVRLPLEKRPSMRRQRGPIHREPSIYYTTSEYRLKGERSTIQATWESLQLTRHTRVTVA